MTPPEPHPEVILPSTATGFLINPDTGAVITDDSSDDDLIDFLAFLREAERRVAALDAEVSQMLRERADARKIWTLAGGRASMPSNRPVTEWDEERILLLLAALVAERELSDDMYASVTKVSLVASNVKVILAGASPAVAARINACRTDKPRTSRKVKLG